MCTDNMFPFNSVCTFIILLVTFLQEDRFGFLPLKEKPNYRVTGLTLYNSRSNFLDLENDIIWVSCGNTREDRRRVNMRISLCFIRFLISGLEEPKKNHQSVCFARIGSFYF